MNRNDEIKEIMQEPQVPERLLPESVKKTLDEQQTEKKQKTIRHRGWIRWTAGVAACTIVLGTGGYMARQAGNGKNDVSEADISFLTASAGSYSLAAENYEQVEALMKHYIKENIYVYSSGVEYGAPLEEEFAMQAVDGGAEESSVALGGGTTATSDAAAAVTVEGEEYSRTYNQEQGVLESDIVLTDGEYLYCKRIGTEYDQIVEIVPVADGVFGERTTLMISDDIPETVTNMGVHSMYLKDGRLIVLVEGLGQTEEDSETTARTYVLTYAAGAEPVLLGCYSQDGSVTDVRLMEDGTMYLVTNDSWYTSYVENDLLYCIPAYGCDGVYETAAPEEILLPAAEVNDETAEIECEFSDSFTNIGSLNVLSDTPDASIDFKCLAGFGGSMYCSIENIYLSSYQWKDDGEYTDFTRLTIDGGSITPTGSAAVPGYVKDQFSMSEYNGYFRAAVTQQKRTETRDEYVASMTIEQSSAVYVFDSNMEQVGALEGIAPTETIKSASFQGDLLYLVTFRQTDPLFSIDLSDPANPVILDEYKITGYSSYMQQWDENLLLGFGIDADENGMETGLKLVMFDNSDPSNLIECGYMPIHVENIAPELTDGGYLYSEAAYERKMLLIAPEKNLIAVPFDCSWVHPTTKMYVAENGYALYSYEDGSFTQLGVYYTEDEHRAQRSLYIGDYAYLVNSGGIVAVDLMNMQETDRITF